MSDDSKFVNQLSLICVAGVLMICGLATLHGDQSHGVEGTQTVKLTDGTNIAATVSPDQKTIIMDLQGSLWTIPFQGGTAKQLTDPLLEPARPDYSPKGGMVAFEAYKGGTFHIWTMKPDGSGLPPAYRRTRRRSRAALLARWDQNRLRFGSRVQGQLRHLGARRG